MSDVEDHDFQGASSGASATVPKQCSALRKSDFVVIKGRPCKVVEMSTSKTGKHGHAKVHMIALDIFTGKKLEDICPSTHNMEVPIVKRQDYQLIDINDEGFLTLLDDKGDTREDVKVPEGELGEAVRTNHENSADGIMVTVVAAMGEEAVLAWKNMQSGKE